MYCLVRDCTPMPGLNFVRQAVGPELLFPYVSLILCRLSRKVLL